MMNNQHLLLALITGLLQGVIEWLPVSSKTMNLLVLSAGGIPVSQAYALGLIANFGSFFAALFYFRYEGVELLRGLRHPLGKQPEACLLRFIILGTLATGVVGVPIYELSKRTLSLANGSVAMLLVGGLLLLTGYLASRKEKLSTAQSGANTKGTPGAIASLFVGACQGLAALPGISRSGVTITPLLAMGYNANDAIRFSFLLDVIALVGAGAVPLVSEGGFLAVQELGIGSTLIMLMVATLVSFFTIEAVLHVAQRLKTSLITYIIAGITMLAAIAGLITVS